MASMRDIKRRRSSIQNTQQITKAMKLVSTVRLQRSKTRAERSRAYFKAMQKTVSSILERSKNIIHPLLSENASSKKAVVMISSNRGLAGGFNSNVIKLITRNEATADWKKEDVLVYAIGNKGRDALNRYGYTIMASEPDIIEEPLYTDAQRVSELLLDKYAKGEIGEIYVAYTEFKNTVTHIPTLMRVLPVSDEAAHMGESEAEMLAAGASDQGSDSAKKGSGEAPMNYEPSDEEVLGLIIPKYVSSMIFGALTQSIASENGARMQAMDNATNNAEDMIQSLSLQYNRARQGSITQELTEIIAGAEAIS